MRKPPGLRGAWAHGDQPTRPFNDAQPTRPFNDTQPARPAAEFQPTRPFNDFQPTRPLSDFQHTRPLADFQPTRPTTDFQPTRPLADGRAATPPVRRPPPPVPAPPPPARAGEDGHWQVRGTPGQHLVLMPGQMHLGRHVASLRTLLGSCVAITLWHPLKKIGGMCHFLLPRRMRRDQDAPDGRYGDEAVAEMVRTLTALQTRPQDYVAHLYGGADTMSGVSAARFNIGERNIEQGWALIEQYGFQLDGVDVGEDIPRTVSLQLATGAVAMRRGTGQAPDHLRS